MSSMKLDALSLLADIVVEFNAPQNSAREQFERALKDWKWSGSALEDVSDEELNAWYEEHNY